MRRALLKKENRAIDLLAVILCGSLLFVFHSFLFGNDIPAFYDIGSDTTEQYLSLYAMFAEKLRAGDFSAWSWNDGFGVNIFQFNPTNPSLMFAYLLGAVFGTQIIPHAMLWLYMSCILLAGLFAYRYLRIFDFDELPCGIAAYLYAFSGFMTVWGQHYQFMIVPLLLILELTAIEYVLREQREWPRLCIVTFLVITNSLYTAYMILLFSCVYVLIRTIMEGTENFVGFVKKVAAQALPMLLGLGLAMLFFLPSLKAIQSSGRLLAERSLFERLFTYTYPADYYRTLLGRVFSSTARGVNDYVGYLNYYEGPCLFFSTLFILLLPQYLFLLPSRKMPRRRKVCHGLAFVLFIVSVMTCFVPVLMNGGVASFSRWMFLAFPYFALVSASTLHELIRTRRVHLPALVLSVAVVLRFYIMYLRATNIPSFTKVMAGHLLGGLLMALLLFLLGRPRFDRFFRFLAAALCVLTLANVCLDTYSNFYQRVTVQKNGEYFSILYDEDTAAALQYLRETDGGFYRTEKTFGATHAMDAAVQGYHPVSTYNSTQNKYIADYVMHDWDELYYEDTNHYVYALGLNQENEASLAGVKYVLSQSASADIPGMKRVRQFGSVFLYQNESVTGIASYYDVTAVKETETEAGEKSLSVSFDQHATDAVIDFPEPANSSLLRLRVDAKTDGYLYLAMPFEAGWTASVDGAETKLELANRGFVALPLSAGAHAVRLQYHAPGLSAGLAISAVSLIIFLMLFFGKKRRRHAV